VMEGRGGILGIRIMLDERLVSFLDVVVPLG
jgi:hypothetical protein